MNEKKSKNGLTMGGAQLLVFVLRILGARAVALEKEGRKQP